MKIQEMILEDGITTIVLVHYVYRSAAGTTIFAGNNILPDVEGTWKVACAPNLMELSAHFGQEFPWQRSDDPRAVNCPLCKRTNQYQHHMKWLGERIPQQTVQESVIHLCIREVEKDSWRVACIPGKIGMSQYVEQAHKWPAQQTDNPRAVTCELCKKALAYRQRLDACISK